MISCFANIFVRKYNNFMQKKIVFIISFRDFKDEEYFVPKGILENGGAEIKTASNILVFYGIQARV